MLILGDYFLGKILEMSCHCLLPREKGTDSKCSLAFCLRKSQNPKSSGF